MNKKWQNLAPPDDPNSYYDIDGFVPTKRDSYETADFCTGTEYTATSAGSSIFLAWTARTLNTGIGTYQREYVVDGNSSKIWQYASGALTDRTGTAVVATVPMFAQFGNVTIAAMGGYKSAGIPDRTTVISTGGNFADLAAAPHASIVAVQSNIVWMFDTGTGTNNGSGWATSDVSDHTNWTTGEAASGTLIATQGDITAAVPFGNDMIVFKENSIYRMRYVGGVVKIASEVAVVGLGASTRFGACAGRNGILFLGGGDSVSTNVYWWDGASYPQPINEFTAIPGGSWITYDPRSDVFAIVCSTVGSDLNPVRFYCPSSDMWGQNKTPIVSGQTNLAFPVIGDYYARPDSEKSPQPVMWGSETASTLKRFVPSGTTPSSCYVETAKIGQAGRKTAIKRAQARLRRKVDLGTESSTATLTLFRNLEDTSAQTTRSGIAESTVDGINRFDFDNGANTDTYGRVKIIWNAYDVELDDVVVNPPDAGKN